MSSLSLQDLNEQLLAQDSVDGLQSICGRFCELVEIEYFLFGVCEATSLSSPKISTISNYPSEWFKTYFQQDMQKDDPVVRYCFANTAPIRWNKLMNMREYVTLGGEQIMAEAQRYGLLDGLSVPIKAPSGEIALFSLATSTADRLDERLSNALLQAIPFSNFLFEHYMRLQCDPASRHQLLTEREKECLFWACEGKTAWEMSKIINVSERTVIFHLTSATKKLGAANRQHAVAKAIMYGLVKPQP
jgi:DNA-binding CsgD family transcriptional regulator